MTIKINGTNTTASPSITGPDTDTGLVYGTNEVSIVTGGTEKVKVDSSGRLLCGTSTSPTAGNGQYANIVIQGYPNTSAGAGHISLQRGQAAFGANNQIGLINFGDNTGASYAGIECYADADSGTNDYPGRLVFSSTADGASSPTERLRITSGGFVGIGSSSPAMRLDVKGTVSAGGGSDEDLQQWNIGSDNVKAEIKYVDANADRGMRFGTSTAHNFAFQTNNTKRMLIDYSGGVFLGDSSSTNNVFANTNSAAKMHLSGGGSGSANIDIHGSTHASDAKVITFDTSNSEQMRLDASGRLLVGATASTEPCRLFATSTTSTAGPAFVLQNTDGGATSYNITAFYRESTGVGTISTTNSATAYNTSSDYRLKENVVAVTDGITRLQQLKPSRFNFIVDPDKTVDGFLAHEAQVVVPEAVTGEKDGEEMQGIDQAKLVPLLTAALQEAIAKIETLETQNASFEARLTALEGGAN